MHMERFQSIADLVAVWKKRGREKDWTESAAVQPE